MTNGRVTMIWLGFGAVSSNNSKQPNSLLKCLQLKQCTWIQLSEDYDGHNQISRFIVLEVENRERSSHIVKPVKEKWMAKEIESGHGEDLPEDMVEESWLEQCTDILST
jgi:hypothetical protein